MKVLVSACLLGANCKYNGGNNWDPRVAEFVKDKQVIPVCPEMEAGMGIPRTPIELRGGRVVDREGNDVDQRIRETVSAIVRRLGDQGIDCAVLKSRSPTCGVLQIYDGTFTGTLTDGQGVFAQALQEAGIPLIDAQQL